MTLAWLLAHVAMHALTMVTFNTGPCFACDELGHTRRQYPTMAATENTCRKLYSLTMYSMHINR